MDPVLDRAPCGFLTVTDDGHVAAANATLCEMLSMKPGAIAGTHVDAMLTSPGRIFYQTHVFPTLKLQARVNEIYLALRDAKGNDVPVMVNIWRRPRDERFVSDWVVIPMRQRDGYENEILAARDAAEASARDLRSRLEAIAEALRVVEKSKDPEEIARAIAAITSQVA